MGYNYLNFYGLLFSCPFDSELTSCQLKKIRQLTTKERLIYYSALAENEKKVLLKEHQRCLLVRDKKSLFHESQ